MADPTTIIDYATQLRDKTIIAVTAAQQRLAQAQSDSVAAATEVATASKEFADLENEVADIRKKLSAIPTPADGDLLLKQLEQAIIDSRAKQAEILGAQTALTAAQSEASLAQSDLAMFSAQLTSAEAALKLVDPASKRRAKWVAALAAPPLATIKTDASNAAAVGVVKLAQKRIADDIPSKLLTRAEQRRSAEAARIANTTAEREAAEAAAADPKAALLRLESTVGDFFNTAQSRFDQAQTRLAQVADKTNSPLTTEQIAAINAPDPLKTAREAAVDAEKKRDDKLKDLTDKEAVRDAFILAAIISNTPATRKAVTDAKKDVADAQVAFDLEDATWRAEEKLRDSKQAVVATRQAELAQAIQAAIAAKKDPDTDANVKTARTNLKNAQDDLLAKEDLYRKSNHGILHAWEAAVPEGTWKLLDDYEGAVEILNTMPDPVTLSNDLLGAETAYVQAQLIADGSTNVLVQLVAEQAQRAAREESARQTSAASLFSALRGDN